jgi:hypothetical protein
MHDENRLPRAQIIHITHLERKALLLNGMTEKEKTEK